jgi:hypothetical protein
MSSSGHWRIRCRAEGAKTGTSWEVTVDYDVYTAAPPPPPPPPSPPPPNVPNGCDDVPGSGKVKDECGVCDGDGSSCAGCDGKPNSGKVKDECGVCDGDGSSCAGCDGKPNSGKVKDECGVCDGDGSSCKEPQVPEPGFVISGPGGGLLPAAVRSATANGEDSDQDPSEQEAEFRVNGKVDETALCTELVCNPKTKVTFKVASPIDQVFCSTDGTGALAASMCLSEFCISLLLRAC